ncbi:MAG: RNA-directed DNA polymerase [Candidatus Eisenbacteria bacterium]|nr:RNA-directed DNA polymerase [Candidatus Eisenbacteria bacterium]
MTQSPAADPGLVPLVSMRRLEQLLGRSREDLIRLAEHAGRYYAPFDEFKPNRAEPRHIDRPVGELKLVQERIQTSILRHIPLPPTMLGGVKRCSIRDNAQYHLGSPLVVTIDLRDCFPRTHDLAVYSAFCRVLGASEKIARLLTKLTTYQHRVPQGAPTSSLLVNWVLLPLHDAIQTIAQGADCRCTFWVDDITVSGPAALDVVEPIVMAIQRHGYSIRHRKLHLMPACRPQEVTGVLVNRHPAARREYRTELRATILQLSSEVEVSARKLERIKGRISHVRHLHPRHGESLDQLLERTMMGRRVDELGACPPKEVRTRVRCNHVRRHRAGRRASARSRADTGGIAGE